jgi:hypothetical protein
LPDIAIQKTHSGGSIFFIGETLTETVTVSVSSTSTPIFPSSTIRANEVIPIGMSNVSIAAKDWSILATGSTSPLFISAVYVGTAPLGPGTNLPPIIITETVNANAGSTLIDSASSSISGDGNPANNVATDIFFISSAPYTPTPSASVTPSPTSSPTPVVYYTPVALPANLPDVVMMEVQPCSNLALPRVGDRGGIILTVSNDSLITPIDQNISIIGVIPQGLTDIKVSGTNWTFSLSSDISPMIFKATFSSPYLLAPTVTLPPITVLGTLTNAAVPSVTNYFETSIAGDGNPNNNYVTGTFPVLPALTSNIASRSRAASLAMSHEVLSEMERKLRNCNLANFEVF